ncbi:nonribosomal peptide synthetase [Anopheles sinensis]|uniref:Nonribosomal peptide synthetase n=1 Tax=Anopheles sinensis TaxID=74873 RepID=A0A084WGN8_ANOSI|nr:nonribosomal peptide synthetase [Anopheles sinensis]
MAVGRPHHWPGPSSSAGSVADRLILLRMSKEPPMLPPTPVTVGPGATFINSSALTFFQSLRARSLGSALSNRRQENPSVQQMPEHPVTSERMAFVLFREKTDSKAT